MHFFTRISAQSLFKFQELKQKVDELSNILSELKSSSPKNENKSELLDDISSEIPKEKKDNRQLSRSALAKRLKVSPSTINRYQNKVKDKKITKEEYIEWTKKKDPENKGWFFDEKTNYSV